MAILDTYHLETIPPADVPDGMFLAWGVYHKDTDGGKGPFIGTVYRKDGRSLISVNPEVDYGTLTEACQALDPTVTR